MELNEMSPGNSVTDLSFLRVYSMGNTDLMKNFIKSFLDNTPVIVQQMEKQYEEKNWHTLGSTAHKLKPQLLYMGMKEAEEIIRGIETDAKEEKDIPTFSDSMNKLKELVNRAYEELKNHL